MTDFDFTVLLPVYKKDDPILFKKAVESIFNNTLQPREVLIVADGELTADLIGVIDESYLSGNVRLVQMPNNLGLACALNFALNEIKTKFTIRADADDYNYSNRFDELIKKLREGYDLVGSAIREVDKLGRFVAIRKPPESSAEIMKFVRKRNPFNHMTVGFRTSVVIDAGGYPSIYLKEDYALWAKLLAQNCKACNLSTILVDATAGREMFRRRGGVAYSIAEVDLQKHLIKCGLKSPASAFFDGILRSLIFLAPNFLREIFYLKLLRTKK